MGGLECETHESLLNDSLLHNNLAAHDTLLTLWCSAESEHVVLGVSTEPQHVVLSARIPLSVTHPHPLAEPEWDRQV